MEAVFAVGTTDAGFSPTGVVALHGLKILAVDVGLAEVDFAAGFHRRVEVSRVDRGGEAVFRVVRKRDGFFEAGNGDYRRDGAEDFALDDVHVVTATGEDGGLIKMPAGRDIGAGSASDNLRALRDGTANEGFHFLEADLVDEGSVIDAGIGKGISATRGGHGGGELFGELGGDFFVDINALGAVADLAAVDEARAFDGVHSEVDIGIGKDDGRGFSAEFEIHLRDVFRG